MDTAATTTAAPRENSPASNSGTNGAVSIRRLVPTETGSSNAAPETADELIDAFVSGFDFFTKEQMLDAIDSGMFQIYKLTRAAYALVEFVDTRYGKTMNILTVAGSREEWQGGWNAVEKIARSNNCNMIYSVGHPGWKRFMEAQGFTTEPMLKMTKEVNYDSVS
jgi:hypothetical protein